MKLLDAYNNEFYLRLLNNRDENGRSVLHWAASSGQKQLVQWLIEHNVEIDALDDSRYKLKGFNEETSTNSFRSVELEKSFNTIHLILKLNSKGLNS